MRVHVIENGLVVNTILVDSLDISTNLVEATAGGIGWSFDQGIFKLPVLTDQDQNSQVSAVRSSRNKLLMDSDWTQMSDVPINKAAWATYRQELRDISAQVGFPWIIEWPVSP